MNLRDRLGDLADRALDWTVLPGFSRIGYGLRESLVPRFDRAMKPLLRDPDAGADTIVWLARSPAADEQPGAFWHDRRPPLSIPSDSSTAPPGSSVLPTTRSRPRGARAE